MIKKWAILQTLLLIFVLSTGCSKTDPLDRAVDRMEQAALSALRDDYEEIDDFTLFAESDDQNDQKKSKSDNDVTLLGGYFDPSTIPSYNGYYVVPVNDNVPFFEINDLLRDSFEEYGDLDHLNRCGPAFALLNRSLMPEGDRGDISSIKPSGYHAVTYDSIEDKFLYNRCHLIAFQLAGENDNELNLITGTRNLNICGMQPFEEYVADYIRKTDNQVLYRVTPIFESNNLIASGVLMEGYSVEDKGQICFNAYVFNIQPGIRINYLTGESLEDNSAYTSYDLPDIYKTMLADTLTELHDKYGIPIY